MHKTPLNSIVLMVLMDLKDITHQTLAELCDVALSTVYTWTSGDANPSDSNFEKLCEIFNVNPAHLVATSRKIRHMARHKTIMKHYVAELTNELPLVTDYRTIQQYESDLERTGEVESGDDTREADITVSG